MRELDRIVRVLADARRACDRALLATVVASEGTTYRKVGARMVVTERCGGAGAVSGGCLESDVAGRCRSLFAAGVPERVTYDTRRPEDLFFGSGLGCSGRIEVLLEPLAGESLAEAHRFLAFAAEQGSGTLGTIVATGSPCRIPLGARLLIDDGGNVAASWQPNAALPPDLTTLASEGRRATSRARSARVPAVIDGAAVELLWEAMTAAPRLALCGAGGDASPVARWAAELGWSVRVIDHRPALARTERFPSADGVALARPGSVAALLAREASDAVVVMSHHFERDAEYLTAALESGAPYVGVLGPRARTERLLAEIAARGSRVDRRVLERLYAPIGLDLGAETPEEIALAIVSELVAVHRQRTAVSLRGHRGRLHDEMRGAEQGRRARTKRAPAPAGTAVAFR